MLSLCTEAFNRHADDFDERYATKVRAELVEAVKEAVENAEELGEEVEELLMDRALDGVLEAKGDELLQFRDDFDEMEADEDSEGEESEDYDDYDVCVDSDGEEAGQGGLRRCPSALETRSILWKMMMMDEGDSEDSDGEEDDEAQRAALSRRTRPHSTWWTRSWKTRRKAIRTKKMTRTEMITRRTMRVWTQARRDRHQRRAEPLLRPGPSLAAGRACRCGTPGSGSTCQGRQARRFLSRAHRCHALLDRRKEQAAIFDAIFAPRR